MDALLTSTTEWVQTCKSDDDKTYNRSPKGINRQLCCIAFAHSTRAEAIDAIAKAAWDDARKRVQRSTGDVVVGSLDNHVCQQLVKNILATLSTAAQLNCKKKYTQLIGECLRRLVYDHTKGRRGKAFRTHRAFENDAARIARLFTTKAETSKKRKHSPNNGDDDNNNDNDDNDNNEQESDDEIDDDDERQDGDDDDEEAGRDPTNANNDNDDAGADLAADTQDEDALQHAANVAPVLSGGELDGLRRYVICARISAVCLTCVCVIVEHTPRCNVIS